MHLPSNPHYVKQFFLWHEDGTVEEVKPPLVNGGIDIEDFADWFIGLRERFPTARSLELSPNCELALKKSSE